MAYHDISRKRKLFKKQSQSQKGAENIQFLRPRRNS